MNWFMDLLPKTKKARVKRNYTAYIVLKSGEFDVSVKGQAYMVIENMRDAITKQVNKQYPGLKFDVLILDENNKEIRYKRDIEQLYSDVQRRTESSS